jgi:hypothetical protein
MALLFTDYLDLISVWLKDMFPSSLEAPHSPNAGHVGPASEYLVNYSVIPRIPTTVSDANQITDFHSLTPKTFRETSM